MIGNDNVSLSVEALSRFNAKCKPEKSTAMKSVIAALYLAQNDNVLKYANIIGLLQLDMDRKLKSKCLRLYNLDTMKLAFEIELYYNFANHYTKLDDKFYYFDYPVGTVGLLFRTKQEAEIILAKIRTDAPTDKEAQQLIEEMKMKQKKQQENNTWFGTLKRKILGKEEVEESGQIKSFKRIFNTGIDAQGHFVAEGQSPFAVDIMERMGLTQKQKKNTQIMDMMANDLLIHQLKKEVIQNPQPQIIELIKQHEKQQQEYLQECRKTKIIGIPPPPPPPPILSPQNRISMNKPNSRANLMDEIRNNKLLLKPVKTNEKGGIDLNLQSMDTVERDDFATALRKKIQMRKDAMHKYDDDEDD